MSQQDTTKSTLTYNDIAELCSKLNSKTKRQFRPGHQLIKLFNTLAKFAAMSEFYDEDEVDKLFDRLDVKYKHCHPHIVKKLASYAFLDEEKQEEALLKLAKKLDGHEEWEWNSRRKAKNRRKTHQNRKHRNTTTNHTQQDVQEDDNIPRQSSSSTLSSMHTVSSYGSLSSEATSTGYCDRDEFVFDKERSLYSRLENHTRQYDTVINEEYDDILAMQSDEFYHTHEDNYFSSNRYNYYDRDYEYYKRDPTYYKQQDYENRSMVNYNKAPGYEYQRSNHARSRW